MRQGAKDGNRGDALGLPRHQRERIANIRSKVINTFHWSPEKFSLWWHTTHPLLDNKTPYNMSQDEDDLKRLEDLVHLACGTR